MTIPKREEETEEKDYYVVVNGRSMLNSTWRRIIDKQKINGVSPSTTPDEELKNYLLSHFREDKKPHKNKTVDLWDN